MGFHSYLFVAAGELEEAVTASWERSRHAEGRDDAVEESERAGGRKAGAA